MLPNYLWPDPQEVAEKLAPIAEELVQRIREENPTALCRELLGGLDGWELWGLACLLAAQVDATVPHPVRVGWVRFGDVIRQPTRLPVVEEDDDEDDPPVAGGMTSAEIDAYICRMVERRKSDEEIGEPIGLTAGAIAQRRRRMKLAPGLRRGETRAERAVTPLRLAAASRPRVEKSASEPAGVGVAG